MNAKSIANSSSPAASVRKGAIHTNWRDVRKGDSLQGSFTLHLPSGKVLFECTFHKREHPTNCAGLPARSYTKPGESKTLGFRLVEFDSRDAYKKVSKCRL